MKPSAIVYTSNTGNSKKYAKMLAEKTGLPVYCICKAKNELRRGTPIIYVGWLMAGKIKNLSKARRRYKIVSICAVGLGATGTLEESLRKSNRIRNEIPVFELQGGMDHSKLKGIYKVMIEGLIKFLSNKKNRTDDETAMLEMVKAGGDFTREENLFATVEWFEEL
jgi:hypothetical protein